MREDCSAPHTLLVIRLPYQSETIHYRAYAERLDGGSVLDWVLARLLAGVPFGVRSVCVCPSDSERVRAIASCTLTNDVSFITELTRHDVKLCRLLMDRCEATRLIVASLSHALAPTSLLRDTLRIHDGAGALLTDIRAPVFPAPLYVVESAMIDKLLAAREAESPNDMVDAASRWFRDILLERTTGVLWQRLTVGALYRINAARWPEPVNIQSATDVNILRRALKVGSAARDSWQMLDAWKRSSITVRNYLASEDDESQQLRTSRGVATPTRVLYVATPARFVGASQSLCHLIEGLDRHRFEPFAIAPYEGVSTDQLRRRDVHVICPNRDFRTPDMESLRFARRVVADIAPDVVHANFTLGLALTTQFATIGVPLIQHVRLADVNRFRLEVYAADAVICVSEFVRERILGLDVNPDKVKVILDGVDVREFKPEPEKRSASRERFGIPADEFVVSVVARMHRQKRIDTVITALGHLRRIVGRGHLLLVGPGGEDGAYTHQIATLIQQERLAPHISHVEFTLDVPTVFHASDCMVLVSWNEALARVVVEAMATGLPVVVGHPGGSKEVVEPGRTGFVVPCGDPDALASVLSALALDHDHARAIGTAAVQAVRSRLTDAHCAEQTMRLYERVVHSRRVSATTSS